MSRGKLNEAMENAKVTSKQLIDIASGMAKKCTQELDALIEEAKSNVNNLSNDAIRDYILRISLLSYTFSEIKEKSILTAQCSETIRKEEYAKNFTTVEGAVAVKENLATMNITDELLVEEIYDLVSSLLKTKLDESHRIVDALKTILTSRLSESKLMGTTSVGQPGEKTYLTE